MSFSQLGLAEPVMRAVTAAGYETPTPIQAQAIPLVISGGDLLGVAQTGTGKTAAFALPVLHRLLRASSSKPTTPSLAPTAPHQSQAAGPRGHQQGRPEVRHRANDRRKTRVLVLSPTRELAVQIGQSFATYGHGTGLRHVVVFGGVSQFHQVKALRAGVDILIATPGRLLDLREQGHIDLNHIEVLILDEADRMLDMGFLPSVRRIVADVPAERQTLFFSATMPDEVRELADSLLREPQQIEITPVATTAERIEQSVCFVEKPHKIRLLRHLLRGDGVTRSLVFTRTKHCADKVVRILEQSDFAAEAIHSNRSQAQRQRALTNFKCGRTAVLVATDIAARGIDVDGISHVFNFDLPLEIDNYVHRIGRTGRAGASGTAISFCSPEERGLLKSIERLIRQRLDVHRDAATFVSNSPRKPHQAVDSESFEQDCLAESIERPADSRSRGEVKPRRPANENGVPPNRAVRRASQFRQHESAVSPEFAGPSRRGPKRPRRFGKPNRFSSSGR